MEQREYETRFALCIRNDNAEDLELRKVYQVVPPSDPRVDDGFLRVIDEAGEDYLYPADYFVVLELPHAVQHALLHAA